MKKFVCILLAIGVLIMISSCSEEKGELYCNAQKYLTEEALEKNYTKGAQSSSGYRYDDVPETIDVVIDSKEVFDEYFSSFPEEVDFSEKIVILRFFTCCTMGRIYYLDKVKLKGDKLEISVYNNHKRGLADVSAPCQRCLAVIMDKCVFSNFEFKVITKEKL